METIQKKYSSHSGWETINASVHPATQYDLVLAFGSRSLLESPQMYEDIRRQFPDAAIILNSTAGEIADVQVNDDTISLTGIRFDATRIKAVAVDISEYANSYDAGCHLASQLETNGLKSVLVISDGLLVNGSELVLGLQSVFPPSVIITGGLAADGALFQKTLVGLNEQPREGRIVIAGFYGDRLHVTYGSVGGWDAFGPERLITRAEGNVLYELDDKPALEIYKSYLGEYAKDLPGSGLLFPLSIRMKDTSRQIVRTILSVNDKDNSLVFAGNMPEGAYAKLMKANFDRLIEGASHAASDSLSNASFKPQLSILISCVGRKLVLDQRIEEEVEVVRAAYGDDTAITGFYSYGEIAPSFNFIKCELHNQTMTITAFKED